MRTLASFLTVLAVVTVLIYGSQAAAVVNAVRDVITTDVKCANGKRGIGTCTEGDEPQPELALAGWTNVTVPLDATGTGQRIDIGGGNNDHADFTTFDPGTLTPGSVVNVFYRATPYNSKLVIIQSGTIENPIVFNGVSDAQGNRPVIDCEGATTVNPQDGHATWVAPYGCWVVTYSRDGGVYLAPTTDNTFQNLEIINANPENTSDGNVAYADGASAIRFNEADRIKLIGNIFRNNGNGIFVHSGNRANGDFYIGGNKFIGNGVVGSYTEHNLYFQVVSDRPFSNIVEGNYFGPLKAGALGTSSMKHRGTDVLFRYNTVICAERCLDLVELQDSLANHVFSTFTAQQILDRYRTAYVYGNQFWLDDARGHTAGYLIHVGMDTGTGNATDDQMFSASGGAAENNVMARGYQSPVYFYHNSIYANSTSGYYKSLFDGDAVSAGVSRHQVEIVAANNLVHITDTTSPHQTAVSHLRHTGQVTYQGSNIVFLESTANATLNEGRDDGAGDDPDITIIGGSGATLTQATTGLDPLFADVTNADLEQIDLKIASGSSAKSAAATLPAPMSNFPVLLQPNKASLGGGAVTRSSTSSLGAYE